MERIYWYLISVALIGILTFISLFFKMSRKTSFIIMAGISFISEIVKIFTHIDMRYKQSDGSFMGYYITPASLPLHLCSILIFIYFYLAFAKNETRIKQLMEFVAPVGLISGLLGIAFATSGTSFTTPDAYQCFIYHSMITWFSVFLMAKREVFLGYKVLIRNIATLFCLSIVMIWINGALSINAIANGNFINFMFLAKPPVNNLPFLTLDYGYIVYFIHLMVAGIALMFVISLPYIISEHKKAGKISSVAYNVAKEKH